jgi:RNA polymerase sigma-70 factor (ECF subfamily)
MVTPLTFVGDDKALMQALVAGHPGAAAVFYDMHAAHVQRTLRSVLGPDEDIPDMLQEVFIRALDHISELREPERVRSWLTSMAIFVARAHIRQRTRRRWLWQFAPARIAAQEVDQPASEARQALREVYSLLDTMPVNERLAFVARFIEGMTLSDAAVACSTSLATLKRRLSRSEKRFLAGAAKRPALAHWLEDGTRWTQQKQI